MRVPHDRYVDPIEKALYVYGVGSESGALWPQKRTLKLNL